MRHYEIVIIVHPDQSDKVSAMLEKYQELVCEAGGKVHRLEDWGRKHMAYPIKKIYKAHYLMLNVECDQETLDKLNYNFRFNDAILRNLVISKKKAITSESAMMILRNKNREQGNKDNKDRDNKDNKDQDKNNKDKK